MFNRIPALWYVVLIIPSLVQGTQVVGNATVPGDSHEAGYQAIQKALRAVLDSAVVSYVGPKYAEIFSRDVESRIHARRRAFIARFSIPFQKDDPFDGLTSRRVLADVSMDVLVDTLAAMGLVWEDDSGAPRQCQEIIVNFQQFTEDAVESCIRDMVDQGIARRVMARVQKPTGFSIRFLAPGDPWDIARKLAAMSRDRYAVKAVEGGTIDLISGGDVSRPPERVRADAPNLEIVQLRIDDIFPARHAIYTSEPCGTVTLMNRSENTVSDVEIEIECPAFLDIPWTISANPIPPKTEISISLVIPFSASRLIGVRQDCTAPVRVICRWGQNPREERKLSTVLTVHSKNAVDWDDVMSACAFVTPRDQAVELVTRQALASVLGDLETIPRGIARSLAISRALQRFDIAYVPDPPAPAGPIYDDIQFARETLRLKSGDCEDSSVLLGSCLENSDLAVQLILTPDHVFIAMNTGLFAKDGFLVSPEREDYIVLDDMVWIPLEATLLGEGFFRAWEEGITTYREIEKEGDYVQLVFVREGWKRYPPVILPEKDEITHIPSVDEQSMIARWIEIHRVRCSDSERELRSQSASYPEDYRVLYDLAVLLARTGRASEAIELFNRIPADGPEGFFGAVGSGNCMLILGDIEGSLHDFEKASMIKPVDPVPYVNKGVAYLVSDDESGAVDAFSDAMARLPGETSLVHLLGVDLGEGWTKADEAAADAALSKQELRALMEKVREKEDWKQLASRGPSRHKFAGRKALDPEDTLRAERLIYWPEFSG